MKKSKELKPNTALNFTKALVNAFEIFKLTKVLIHGISFMYYLKFKVKNNFKIVNKKYLPPRNNPRYILAGNHSSTMDGYLILGGYTGRLFRRCYAIANDRSYIHDTVERLFLNLFGMIPRFGSGEDLVRTMAQSIYNNKTIAIPPEGMTSEKVMKGYTGIMRLYWMVNQFYDTPKIPIIPVVSIGANKAYPPRPVNGKWIARKIGIIGRIGKPMHFKLPKENGKNIKPSYEWLREKTDELMDHIARLTFQKDGAIESFKLNKYKRGEKRLYKAPKQEN